MGVGYDVRALLSAVAVMRDCEKLKAAELNMELLDRTILGDLLRQYGLV